MYYDQSIRDVFNSLKTTKQGLSTQEADKRRVTQGSNVYTKHHHNSRLRMFFRQFGNPVLWVLIAAVIIAGLLGEKWQVVIIAFVILANALLGFIQEHKAEKAVSALEKSLNFTTLVLRDNQEQELDVTELVPGDVVILQAGDKVPADGRVIEHVNLETQEAALTGESTSVRKNADAVNRRTPLAERTGMVYAGTLVTNGRARVVICETGMQTELGGITKLIHTTPLHETPLQAYLKKVSFVMTVGVVFISVFIFLTGLLVNKAQLSELLLVTVALAVAAIPEGLPAVVTLTLALGVQRMARHNALLRNLSSAESLGSCTVICTDKTGTLTENAMMVTRLYVNNTIIIVDGVGYAPVGTFSCEKDIRELLIAGSLNNHSQVTKKDGSYAVIGDPTEAALLVVAEKAGIDWESIKSQYPVIEELDFTSERKRMTTVHHKNGTVAYTKGAVDMVLPLCSRINIDGTIRKINSSDKKEILKVHDQFANKALRVLAFATGSTPEKNMIFLGLQAMIDSPRKEAPDAIKTCKAAGIKVVMITGDHLATAHSIAAQIGITGNVLTGAQLDAMSPRQLRASVEHTAIYARVTPENKVMIVDALQQKGHVVAMTGDGVNDAPALRRADIGISMGSTGTDVAREASSMVLLDDNFATIVRAINEGRRIFENLQKFLAYIFSVNLTEVVIVFSSIILGLPVALSAVQLLWCNLVGDGLPALALGVDPAEPNIMCRKPRDKKVGLFAQTWPLFILYPLVASSIGLWLYKTALLQYEITHARTLLFTFLTISELVLALSCRSITQPTLYVGIWKNRWLWLSIITVLSLQFFVVMHPLGQIAFGTVALSMKEWAMLFMLALAGFAGLEITKLLRMILNDSRNKTR